MKIVDYNEELKEVRTQMVIDLLREMEVDGETMEYIISQTGMAYQMLRQLVMSASASDLNNLIEEKNNLY